MKRWNLNPRALVVPALALATVATLVTGAQADRGNRYKDAQRGGSRSSYRAPGGFSVQRGYAGGSGSSYRGPGGFTVHRGYVGGSSGSYRGPGGFTVHRGYVGGSSGSYRGPGGFVVHRQVYAPRAYYGGYYGGPRVHVHYGSYASYPRFGMYYIQRPVSGGYLCGPVGSGLSLNITLGNVLPVGAYYYDPYCHEEFASLSAYYAHCQGLHEARVQVCQRDNGDNDSYRPGYDDQRDDQGYYNDDNGQNDDGYYDDRGGNNNDGDDDDDDDGGWQQR